MKGAVLLAAGLLTGSAAAAVLLTYATPSTLHVSVVTPPIALVVGQGGTKDRYFAPPLATSENGTSVTGTFQARAGADVTVKDVLEIVAGEEDVDVTFAGERITSAQVELFTWTVKDGSTTVAILDMRSTTPSATFTMPAASTYKIDLRVDLKDGAGKNNTPSSFAVHLEVSV